MVTVNARQVNSMADLGRDGIALSAIVCTRCRPARLRRNLESLVTQEIGSTDWEIIVVDNGSPDETAEVIRSFMSRGPVRYAYEPVQGLARARNRGISVARGRILAFTDDDVVVHSDWAARIVARFEAAPDVSAVFGYTYADPGVPGIYTMVTRPYACYFEGKHRIWETGPGNNMAYRRSVVDRIGLFDPLFGAGAKYPTADDVDFQYRLLKAGFKAFYDPDIKVKHEPDLSRHPLEEEFLRADSGIAAWYGKHVAHGDLYAARMFLARIRTAVGTRSLITALGRGDTAELRRRGRRVSMLLRAFVARLVDAFRRDSSRHAVRSDDRDGSE